MQVKQVDPFDINVDEMNERKDNVNTTELQASVEQQGVIEPPIVRVRDADASVPYAVVVGQRRTIAAQAAGLDSIPVVVRDLSDGDALMSSITENLDAFRESVSKKDRALAIERLKEINGWTTAELAESLGVSYQTVSSWTEHTKPQWEGTQVDPNVSGNKKSKDSLTLSEKIDDAHEQIPEKIRQMTGGGEEGEKLLRKALVENDLSKDKVAEAKQKVDAGEDPEVAIEQVAEEVEEQKSTTTKKMIHITLTNNTAEAAQSFAKSHGMTTNELAHQAIETFLQNKGQL